MEKVQLMKILLKNAYIVTMNKTKDVYTKGDILIEDDKIVAIGRFDIEGECEQTVDCTGKIVMPGLVNTHIHTSQQLGRGLGDDVDILTWLHKRIWPYESSLSENDSYLCTLLSCVEQIKTGVTSFCEAGGQHVPGMVRGVTEAGIRAILTKSAMDSGEGLPKNWQETTDELLDSQTELLQKYRGAADGRIDIGYGIRTIFNATDDMLVRTKELADKHDAIIQMHVAEAREEVEYAKAVRGDTTVAHLNKLGVLGPNLIAVHTVWMTDEEVLMFRDNDVRVSHNPGPAMKGLGFAKVPMMLENGICVTLGTDGAASNNRTDMVSEMYVASLIHKGRLNNPSIVPAQSVLSMVTIDGAKALGQDKSYGSLEIGKKADMIIINPKSAGMYPLHDPIANLVSSMHQSNIESSICNGKWIMKDRIVLTINEKDIKKAAKERADALRVDAGIILPDRMTVVY